MNLSSYGITCILSILTRALAERPTLTSYRMPFARRWETTILSIAREILIFTACFSSMAARTWQNVLPNNYVHYTLAPTMQLINHAQWLIIWWRNWSILRGCLYERIIYLSMAEDEVTLKL